MTVCLDDLGDGFITFPEFQRQLRAYERQQDVRAATVTVYAATAVGLQRQYAMNRHRAQTAYDAAFPPAAPTRCHHGVPSNYTCKACAEERTA